MNAAQQIYQHIGAGSISYKAPHANRGGFAKKASLRNKMSERIKAREIFLENFKKPQPVEHMHSHARRLVLWSQ